MRDVPGRARLACRFRLLGPPTARAWLAASLLAIAWLPPARGQVLQLWSHQAVFGDASGAVAMGDTLMFVNNNEDEILRLYSRYPATSCTSAIYSFDARPNLGATGSDLTADLESAIKLTDV